MNHPRSYTLLAILLLLASAPALFAQNVINCSSNDMHRHFCNMGRFSDARIVNQKSGSPCVRGRTWGIQGNNLWVDRGCRADFQLMRSGGHNNDDRGRGRGETVRCESGNMRLNRCRVNGPIARAQIQRQISGSPCVQDRTWGYDRSGLWVDKGCRADFQVWYR